MPVIVHVHSLLSRNASLSFLSFADLCPENNAPLKRRNVSFFVKTMFRDVQKTVKDDRLDEAKARSLVECLDILPDSIDGVHEWLRKWTLLENVEVLC